MRAVVLDRPGVLRADEQAQPAAPSRGSALVRVHRVGVCGTDIHAWYGRQPFFDFPRILGHELGVEIVQIDANPRGLRPGMRCAVEPYLNCGVCAACTRGRGNCCVRMQVLGVHVDGGMREVIEVPVDKLHPSAVLGLDSLALVETVTIGAHAVRRAAPAQGDHVLVVGAGPIGLSTAVMARATGAQVTVMDVNAARLLFCREHAGLERTLLVSDGDVGAQVRDATGGELPHIVIDATGNRVSMMASFGLVAHAGTLVFVGLMQGDLTFNDPEFHRRELTVLASRNALPADFAHVMAMFESGAVDVGPWITHRAPLVDVPEVFPTWTAPETGVVKAMIEV
jgi:2-desacetyl-2-hydroxyethyl bacteriochlorophyllide A dehydrogenase